MTLSPKVTLTHPIEIGLTAGSNSGVALLIGSGSPDGNTDPWNSAGKGSVHLRIDQTDDISPFYVKVDADGADDDWVPVFVEKDEGDRILEGNLTMDADKRVYFRDTDTSIYSDSACKLYVDAASGVDISKMKVGSGHTFDYILCGSNSASVGPLVPGASENLGLAVTGVTTEHKIFASACGLSACLSMIYARPKTGGDIISIGVANAGSENADGATVAFSYLAIGACGV